MDRWLWAGMSRCVTGPPRVAEFATALICWSDSSSTRTNRLGVTLLGLFNTLFTPMLFVGPIVWSGPWSASYQAAPGSAYERSLGLVRQELARRPDDPGLTRTLARVHLRSAHYEAAANAFLSAIELQPGRGSLWSSLGTAYMELGETDEAIEAFRRVLSLDDEGAKPHARVSLAEALYQKGDYTSATEEMREAVRLGSRPAESHYQLGRSLETAARQQGVESDKAAAMQAEARTHLEKAIELEPAHQQAHYALGRLLSRSGEKEEARRIMMVFKGLSRRGAGMSKEALAESDVMLEAGTAVEVARCLMRQQQIKRALGYVDRAISIHPTDERALFLRGVIYGQTNRKAEALAAYEALLDLHPDHGEGLWNLGLMYLEENRVEEAGALLLRSADLRATSAESWELLARLAAMETVFASRAEEFATRALTLRQSPGNFVRLAKVLFANRRFAECEKVVGDGLKRFPRHAELGSLQASLETREDHR